MIPADRFIFLGQNPGVLIAEYQGLMILWPTFARVPRNVLTPERLAFMVVHDEATEKDDGYPFGPRRLALFDAWRASCIFNPPHQAKRIWEILQEARCGLPHALPPKSRPEELEMEPGFQSRRNRMETVIEYDQR
jgi:hypothetical protein